MTSTRIAVLLALLPLSAPPPASRPEITLTAQETSIVLTEEALRIHRSGLLIDGHNDLLWKIRSKADSSFDKMDISQPQKTLQTDIPRLRRGGVGAQFWAAYVPPSEEHTGRAAQIALEEFDLLDRMMARYPETFELATSADDIERIHRTGKIASLLGVEGGHTIEKSLDTLALFYQRGARYLGLTHSASTDWADSCTDKPRHGGLAPFGEQVIREMNRLGMLVDISHTSHDCMRDVLRVSRAPVIDSHAGAFAVAAHPRNVPDDVLRMLKANGGIVMVTVFPGYIHPEGAKAMMDFFEQERIIKSQGLSPDEAARAWRAWKEAHPIPAGTVQTVVDHIDHIVGLIGIDYVGLGSDYDGVGIMPVQLEDVSGFPCITQELHNRGYTAEDIHKIMGKNFLRVMREAERIARELQKQ